MKRKNTDQFLKIYSELIDGVFRFCFFRTSDREVSLDITQEVFTKIWEYLSKGGIMENTKAFVYSTANRKIIDWYRTKKPFISLDELSESGFDFHFEDKEIWLQVDAERALLKLKDLEDIYKEVLLLRFIEELSVKEIADILNESENNISVRIHRGLEKLRKIYAEEETEQKKKLGKLEKEKNGKR